MKADAGLAVRDAAVRFGSTRALDGVDLDVAPGEIVAIVGPSGCGKSTLLRLVAGLEHGDGSVQWNGQDLTGERPDQRHFGLMFQDHALFAHRSVADNVAFGLKMSGVGTRSRRLRVDEVLELVGMAGYGERAVDSLSGGEAQRVALARSLAPSPRLLMLDEPLGSLDRSLRDRLAADLRRILTDAGLAAIHVTHDQEEAYAVADRLVVMRSGRVERDGPAAEVWADPRTEFVARFLGHRNVLDPAEASLIGLTVPADAHVGVVVREAAISVVDAGEPDSLSAVVSDVRFRGAISQVDLVVDGPTLRVHVPRPRPVGSTVGVKIDPTDVASLLAP